MQTNPYAPPSASPGLEAKKYGDGEPQPWALGEVLSLAFERWKLNWVVVIFSFTLTQIIGAVPGVIGSFYIQTERIQPLSSDYWIVEGITTLAGLLIASFFQTGLIRIWLGAARGEEPVFTTTFGGAQQFLSMFVVQLVTTIVTAIGLFVFIVPGVILYLMLGFAPFFVADANMGPFEAMAASVEAVRGQKLDLFVYAIVATLVSLAGLGACCFGVFATIPLASLGCAIIFVRITGRGTTPDPRAPAYAPPPPLTPPPPPTEGLG